VSLGWDDQSRKGSQLMRAVIDALSHDVPAALTELRRLGRTLKQRAADVLAYFDRPGTSNGPTEAINGRLEHLRGSALGFRNLTNYVARSLLERGHPGRGSPDDPRIHRSADTGDAHPTPNPRQSTAQTNPEAPGQPSPNDSRWYA